MARLRKSILFTSTGLLLALAVLTLLSTLQVYQSSAQDALVDQIVLDRCFNIREEIRTAVWQQMALSAEVGIRDNVGGIIECGSIPSYEKLKMLTQFITDESENLQKNIEWLYNTKSKEANVGIAKGIRPITNISWPNSNTVEVNVGFDLRYPYVIYVTPYVRDHFFDDIRGELGERFKDTSSVARKALGSTRLIIYWTTASGARGTRIVDIYQTVTVPIINVVPINR